MSFANPAFLFAFGLLAIPVIIHLFNFRKFKRVYFTNVALLEEVKEQTQSTSRLKNLLILLSRLLALAALVLAFSEPFIKNKTRLLPIGGTVAVYVDNSPSMSNKGTEGPLLLEAIEKGKSIIEAFPENTAFILTTNANDAKLQRELTKQEALDAVELIKEANTSTSLSDMLKKQQAIANGKPVTSFFISDFQTATTKPQELLKDSSAVVTLVPVSAKNGNNLVIDSLWFSTPTHLINSKEELTVQLTNFGDETVENIPVELFINNQPAGISNATVPAGGKETILLTYVNKQAGFNRCEVKINDSPIQFDNAYFFAYRVNTKLPVVEIIGSNASTAISRLFATDADYQFASYAEQNIDYNHLKGDGCLILNGLNYISTGLSNTVVSKLSKGEAVAIFPGTKTDISSYNTLLAQLKAGGFSSSDTALVKSAKLEHKHPFFKNLFDKIPANIDLPVSRSGYLPSGGSFAKSEALIKLSNGANFVSVTHYKAGQLFLFNTPLSEGNFTQHGLFAPIMLRIAESSGYIQQLAYTIGDAKPIVLNSEIAPRENLFKMKGLPNGNEFIPEIRKNAENILLYPPQTDLKAGNYNIIGENNTEISAIGVNLPRLESNTKVFSLDELGQLCEKSKGKLTLLNEKPEKITNEIKTNYQGQKLWKLFIGLTLLFLTIEILLTKWLK